MVDASLTNEHIATLQFIPFVVLLQIVHVNIIEQCIATIIPRVEVLQVGTDKENNEP